MRVTIFDYGAGNLHSIAKAVAAPEFRVHAEPDARRAIETDVLVLPGVGAFGAAAERLGQGRDAMRSALEAGLPCIAICLGMQLLFANSEEGGGCGLGLIPGHVRRIRAARSPQIGWNSLDDTSDPLLTAEPLRSVYYANRFVCAPRDESCVTAWSGHDGDRFPAIVRWRRTLGVQFHPEKSSLAGVRFLRAFLREVTS